MQHHPRPSEPEGSDQRQATTGVAAPPAVQARAGVVGSVRTALGALEHRDFRILWLGVGSHSVTLWMETVARNLLVWDMTGSGAALGWINFWRTIPVLFLAIPAGVVADRFNRRTILLVTQVAILAIYAVLLGLLATGGLELWHAYLLFGLRGVAIAFNQPPRQALIPTLVKPHQVSNAVALQQILFNGTRVAAPLLTGVLYAASSATVVFAVIVAIEVLIIVAWLALRVPAVAARAGKRPTALGSTAEGLRYVAKHRVVLLLLSFGLLSLLLIQPYVLILAAVTDTKFGIGDEGYGLFISVAGAGAVVGPLLLAFLGDFRAKGALVVGSMALSGVVLIGVGAAPWLLLAMALVGVVGMFDSAQRVLTNSLLLTQTDPQYHGRVVSLYLLDRGFVPIGSLVAGFLIDGVGPSTALMIMGAALVVSVLLLAAAQPRFLIAR